MSSIKLKHASGNGAILNAPAANPSADITLKVPSTTGSAGQVLKVASANHSATNAELEWGAAAALTGSTDNTVCTVTGANAIQGEANVTYDGSNWVQTSSSDTHFKLISANTGYTRICLGDTDDDDAGQFLYNNANNKLEVKTNAVVRMSIEGDGRPSFKVANSYMIVDKDNTGVIVEFQTGSSAKGNIGIGGSDVAYNTTSDYRLKENVSAISDGITRVKQLKPSKFNWIADDTNTLVDGFLAHEVSSVVPNAVTGAKDAVDLDSNPVYQSIDQSKMIPLLTAALKEAIARIEVLEAG